MKTIGIIGGLSWESTITYLEMVNQYAKKKSNGYNLVKTALDCTLNFAETSDDMHNERWDKTVKEVSVVAKKLENYGADFIVIPCNTIHHIYYELQASVNIPIIHIIDPVGEKLQENNIRTAGLLGTKVTMLKNFHKGRLKDNFNCNTIIPAHEDVFSLNGIIYEELCVGKLKQSSLIEISRIIDDLKNKGAQACILSCTELSMIVKKASIPLFDTTDLYARKSVELAVLHTPSNV